MWFRESLEGGLVVILVTDPTKLLFFCLQMPVSFTFKGCCPDIGVDEIPSTMTRVYQLASLARDKAYNHYRWERMFSPGSVAEYKKQLRAQLDLIRKWKVFHELRLLGCIAEEDKTGAEGEEKKGDEQMLEL